MSKSVMLDEALRLAELGFRVFPLSGKQPITPNGVKNATNDLLQVESWWERSPNANIGLASGGGIAIVDVDSRPGRDGMTPLKSLAKQHGWPKTVSARSGGGGRHYFFGVTKDMGEVPSSNNRIAPGIEVLYEGRYVVAPPSVHPDTGQSYQWVRAPFNGTSCAVLPRWLVEMNARREREGPDYRDLQKVKEGEGRNVYLTQYAGSLRREAFNFGEIYDALMARNERICDPPLPEREVRAIAKSVARYKPEDPMVLAKLDDVGNAERFASYAKGSTIFVPGAGWHVWDHTRWRPDTDGLRVQETAKRASREILSAAQDMAKRGEKDRAKQLFGWAQQSAMRARVEAMVKFASSQEGIAVDLASLDKQERLVNTKNGTFNLETGQLQPHNPEDLITQVAPVFYDPEAECPLWEEFVLEVLPDPDVREYTRRAVGYSLTASTREQCFFLMIGTGSNGKSTFIETIRELMGSYAAQIEAATLLAGLRTAGSASPDLMMLRGPRLVVCTEVSEGARLNESLIKGMTGQDTVTARPLYKNPVEFQPRFKLWMHSNHLPRIKGQDRGIWRRIKLIPFTEVIRKPDKSLPEKLLVELPGIFNWAVRGYQEWASWGLREPKPIRRAVERYQGKMNIVSQFVEEQCKLGDNVKVPIDQVWEAFFEWQKGLPKGDWIGRNGFYERLDAMGFEQTIVRSKHTRRRVRHYVGIQLDQSV